jgi:hypothetical protein
MSLRRCHFHRRDRSDALRRSPARAVRIRGNGVGLNDRDSPPPHSGALRLVTGKVMFIAKLPNLPDARN